MEEKEKINELKKLECKREDHLIEWTKEFEKMVVEYDCPQCGWAPDCEDNVISHGLKKYSYYLSLLSSFLQYSWCEIYECPKCNTLFKSEAESI